MSDENILRVILGDQLSDNISSLISCDKSKDIIFMCEVLSEIKSVHHHKKKIVFILSAMRHFREHLKKSDYKIIYTELEDPDNKNNFTDEVSKIIQQNKITKIIITHPSEYRVLQEILAWKNKFAIPVDIRPDTRFLSSILSFKRWAQSRKQLRMEYFYREIRAQYNILMDAEQPIGGQWNFDKQNRKPPKTYLDIPKTYCIDTDIITNEIIKLVEANCADHFGDIHPFHFAVTRKQALAALDLFINQRLTYFGDYQDAMLESEPWMYHSHISLYLNCGLLNPLECVKKAEQAYANNIAPLNAVEGFIRQIIGWREYVRGIYWLKMPDYAKLNFLNAKRPLPEFYWTGNTKMNCLKQSVLQTKKYAYAHHIQRLMVLGNFALLTGIDPEQVNQWFLIVYADAFEWVELPNVTGMSLFADGGFLGSKPYASGGSYINKMSDYCKNCYYKINEKTGEQACPFNYLYWDFLERHRDKLIDNPRMKMMYMTYDKLTPAQKKLIKHSSEEFLQNNG